MKKVVGTLLLIMLLMTASKANAMSVTIGDSYCEKDNLYVGQPVLIEGLPAYKNINLNGIFDGVDQLPNIEIESKGALRVNDQQGVIVIAPYQLFDIKNIYGKKYVYYYLVPMTGRVKAFSVYIPLEDNPKATINKLPESICGLLYDYPEYVSQLKSTLLVQYDSKTKSILLIPIANLENGGKEIKVNKEYLETLNEPVIKEAKVKSTISALYDVRITLDSRVYGEWLFTPLINDGELEGVKVYAFGTRKLIATFKAKDNTIDLIVTPDFKLTQFSDSQGVGKLEIMYDGKYLKFRFVTTKAFLIMNSKSKTPILKIDIDASASPVNPNPPKDDITLKYLIKIKQPAIITINVKIPTATKPVTMNLYIDQGLIKLIEIRDLTLVNTNTEHSVSNTIKIPVNSPEALIIYDTASKNHKVYKKISNLPDITIESVIVAGFKVVDDSVKFSIFKPENVKISYSNSPANDDNTQPSQPPQINGVYYPLKKYLEYAYIVYYPILKYSDRSLAIRNIPEMKYTAQVFIYNKRTNTPIQVNKVTIMSIKGATNVASNAPITLTQCKAYDSTCPTLKVKITADFNQLYYTKNDVKTMTSQLKNKYTEVKQALTDYRRTKTQESKLRAYSEYYNYVMLKYIAKGYYMVLVVNATIDNVEYNLILPIPQYLFKYYKYIEQVKMKR